MPRVEPWVAAYARAVLSPRAPRVYVLVSWRDAQALAAGRVSRAVQRQAQHLVTWQPGTCR